MKKQTFIPGGIYTDYKNDLAIFTGIYSDSHEEDKNTFILLEDCQYRTHEEIVNYIKRIGIDSIMPYIQMLHLKNDYYAYGYIGQMPENMWKEMDSYMKEWSQMPWQKE